MCHPFRAKIFIYLIPRAVALGYLLSALWALEEIFLCLNLCNGFYPHPLSIYSLFWTRMNIDFVVMVRQTHHERHCILSLRRELSRTLVEGSVEQLSGLKKGGGISHQAISALIWEICVLFPPETTSSLPSQLP